MILGVTLLGGLFLGWGIGANNGGNIFGTAVGTNSVSFRTAVILIAVFVIIGSMAEGYTLYPTYTFSGTTTIPQALICTLAAAVMGFLQTYFGIPGSTTQSAIGGVMVIAIWSCGIGGADWWKLK